MSSVSSAAVAYAPPVSSLYPDLCPLRMVEGMYVQSKEDSDTDSDTDQEDVLPA